LHQVSIATPSGSAKHAVGQILDTAGEASSQFRLAGCGIAVPAVVDAGILRWAPEALRGWNGLALAALAERALGTRCAVEFDGYAAALGERWLGRTHGFHDSLVMIVGTGIGAGYIHRGRLVRGSSGVAGAVGWLRSVGRHGMSEPLEEVASGAAILRNAIGRLPVGATPYVDTASVFAAADTGDPIATRTIGEAVSALGDAVGGLVSMLAPQIIVLGGGVGSRPDLVDRVREVARRTAQPHSAAAVVIEPSSLGGQSSLIGAAYLATQSMERGRPDE
jgi:glucokinase